MRYTNFTETTQSLKALKFKGSLFLKSSERNLKEMIILFIVKILASLGFSTKQS